MGTNGRIVIPRISRSVLDSDRIVAFPMNGELSRVDIRSNRVVHASSAGIEIFEASDGIVRDNTLVDNQGLGLRLLEAFRTEVKHNTTQAAQQISGHTADIRARFTCSL